MKLEIFVDGKPYLVELIKWEVGKPFSITINEKPCAVALEQEPRYEKPFVMKFRGKPYEIELAKMGWHVPFSVKVNNVDFKVELRSARRRVVPTLEAPTSLLVQKPSITVVGEGVVAAPMSGKIIAIKVKKGDHVKTGDVVCTLEAMKMENEIVATKKGVVEEVRVQEGKVVNEGDILIVIK